MKVEDAESASKVAAEVMQKTWDLYEKEYYPKRALEFDLSLLTPEKYVSGMQEQSSFYFVAEEEGKIVGVVTGTILRGNQKEGGLARVGWTCVHPSQQRRGMGRALLNHVIECGRQQKCHKITLYTLPVLIPALNLYFKLGFVPEAFLQKEWWGVDFIKMSKWLQLETLCM